MSKFLDRKEQVIEIELTKYGRRSFAMGKFVPKYYSFHDDDILYDQNYRATGSQAARPAVANLDIINNTAATYNAKTLIIKDTANTTVTYTFANATFNASSVPTIGVAGNTTTQIAANIKTAIEHANGHNGTISARVVGGTRVKLVQAVAGVDGNRAIAGNIPAAMILTGSDAVATSFTGGKDATITAPELISTGEKQNDIVDRIETTPRVSIISDGGWEKNHRFFTATGEISTETTNVGSLTPGQISPANAKFLRPIGTSSPVNNFAPAWEIKAVAGSETLTLSGTEQFPYKIGASGSEVIVPYFSSSLPLEYEVQPITINVDGNDVVIEDGGREVTENLFEITKEGRLLLDVQELNTVLNSAGNFDIEVFRAPIIQGVEYQLGRLDFINENFMGARGLSLQQDPDEYARALAGDDEIIGENVPLLDPSYVEYFLSIRVDDGIEDIEQIGETLYQGGPSDPVDPCEDV